MDWTDSQEKKVTEVGMELMVHLEKLVRKETEDILVQLV